MNTPTVEDYGEALDRFAAAHPFVTLDLSPEVLMTLLGCLQVVLRHPALPDGSRRQMTSLAIGIETVFHKDPLLKQVAQMGWHRKYDEPIGDELRQAAIETLSDPELA